MKKSVHNLFRIPVHKMLDFPNYLHISLVKLLHTKSYFTVSTALKIFLLYHKSHLKIIIDLPSWKNMKKTVLSFLHLSLILIMRSYLIHVFLITSYSSSFFLSFCQIIVISPITKTMIETASTIPLHTKPMIFHFITAAVFSMLRTPRYNPSAASAVRIHPIAPLNTPLVPPVFTEPKSSR